MVCLPEVTNPDSQETKFYVDMNECSKNSSNSCQQVCLNTPGSYTCRCQTGFRLHSDGRTCEG